VKPRPPSGSMSAMRSPNGIRDSVAVLAQAFPLRSWVPQKLRSTAGRAGRIHPATRRADLHLDAVAAGSDEVVATRPDPSVLAEIKIDVVRAVHPATLAEELAS
jgi:hypothetical protein